MISGRTAFLKLGTGSRALSFAANPNCLPLPLIFLPQWHPHAIVSALAQLAIRPTTPISLAKHILKQRLVRHVYFYSALVCWIQGYIWTVWLLGGVEQLGSSTFVAPFYPLTILLAGATWLVALYQPIVIQKAYLTTTPTPAASPSALVKSAFPKSNTKHSVMAYLLSSISILLYVIFDGDTKTGFSIKVPPFFSSRVYAHSGHRKHPLYLNPRLICLKLPSLSSTPSRTSSSTVLSSISPPHQHFDHPTCPRHLYHPRNA